ncbi:asparagine synthase (glutamine-hydrolyzing) [Allocatelliglobosispora scoriae]|uniref:Asparagine synthase (Glutamine-hydrolyzing) n=1 Tax=Allocatelliglobosispora scoriae TaxID=643052 RepID=A0A841BZE9_9ACTN|nr:hypothetical protein [Allocatelliglobosispora scoriae]MBB5872090.1 asparagine synthase (glutamine-hydrolyzing) [Allocatelliglobosispora scoriae]
MRAFLAVSVAPRHDATTPTPSVLAQLSDDDTTVDHVRTDPDGWIAFAGADAGDDLGADAGAAFTVLLSRAGRTRRGDVSTADLAAMLAPGGDPRGLTDVLPPFAVAHRAAAGGPTVVATDWLGFRQLYWWRGDGIAAVSTSARALAALAGAAFDDGGLGTQALVGWQVSDTTIFAGVRVLPPATIATLRAGQLEFRTYAEPPASDGVVPALDDAVAEMAEILTGFQTAYLDDHPDTVLQLTGGHDSRILLGAIPVARRNGLRALTLDSGGGPDATIAAKLSARYGIRHHVHLLDSQPLPTPAEAHRLAIASAEALECMASPLALAPLLLAESHLDQGHRLSGLGGEVARGFYYAGQPAGAATSPQLVERLAKWRLFSNEAVTADALEPGWLDEARSSTLAKLNTVIGSGDWLRATDEFYLFHRMHRWAAAHGTVAAVRRHFINPMFDRRFIELALAVAPAEKRDSLLLGRLMTHLDRELALTPLDSGLIPAKLGRRTAATRLATGRLTARKAVRKIQQRLTRSRRAQFGASTMSGLVLAHWRQAPGTVEALRSAPMLRQQWVDGLLKGEHTAEPTTMAFLINVVAASTTAPR